MGRPGAGSGGSGSGGRSGGGFRPSPSSGSRPGASSRPSGGSGSRRSGGGTRPPSRPPSSRGYGAPPPPRGGYGAPPPRGRYGAPPPPRRGYGTPGRRYGAPPMRSGGYGRSRGGCAGTIIGAIVLVVILVIVLVSNANRTCMSCLSCGGKTQSAPNNNSGSTTTTSKQPAVTPPVSSASGVTVNKNKPSAAFTSDCIIDELNWFEDVQKTGEDLKFVYDKLGIQPYIVFRRYDASLVSDGDKIRYCEKWYDENIKNEDTFLFMYFAEKDSDNDIGYMAYWPGKNAAKLSDKFGSVFEQGINEYWFEDLSTDDVIKSAFQYTCNKITVKQNGG